MKSFYRWTHPLVYNDHGPRIWTYSVENTTKENTIENSHRTSQQLSLSK